MDDGTPTNGSLSLTDGVIAQDATSQSIAATLVGEITFEEGVVSVDTEVAGAFTSEDASYLHLRADDEIEVAGSDVTNISVRILAGR